LLLVALAQALRHNHSLRVIRICFLNVFRLF
jgi:hypothetical protein